MSAFYLCDGDDCDNTEDEGLFDIPFETRKFLEEHYPCASYYNGLREICENCIVSINESYDEDKPLLIKEHDKDRPGLLINQIYLDNPELTKEENV